MKHIIQATIKGVKYFAKFEKDRFSHWEGLKDNATQFHSHGAAKTELEFLLREKQKGIALDVVPL